MLYFAFLFPHISMYKYDTNHPSCVQETRVYKERRVPEGFLAFPACQDLLAAVDPRETGEVTVTPDVPALGWRGPGVPRVLMAPRDLRELENLDLRVSEAPQENKVSLVFLLVYNDKV